MTEAAPGWYPDPEDTQYHRWWDGSAWTGHTNRPQESVTTPNPNRTATEAEQVPRKKSRKVLFSVVGAVTAAALVVGGIVVVNTLNSGSGGVEANGYLWEPVTYLDPDESFTLPFDVDPDTLSSAKDEAFPTRGVIDVYIDDAFTIVPRSALVFWMDDDRGLTVDVLDTDEYSWATDSEPLLTDGYLATDDVLTSPGAADTALPTPMWTEMDRYYVVQSFDRNGEKLETPIVHTIEASDEDDLIHEPIELITSIGDTPGSVKLSWNEPEGMSDDFSYYIIKTRPDDVIVDGERTDIRAVVPQVIAETTETSWQSKPVLANEATSQANRELALYGLDSADDLNFGFASGTERTRAMSDLAVIALSDDRTERTSLVLQSVVDEIGGFPYKKARGQARDLFPADAGDLTGLPTWYPVTTLDGDTSQMRVSIDTAAIESAYESFWNLDGTGEFYTRMPFTITGTAMSGAITAVKPDALTEEQWLAQSIANAEAYNARAQSEGPLVGDTTLAQDPTMSLDAFNDIEPVVEVPDSPYDVYGSNEFSTFLAGHMVGGTRLIDMTEYVETPGFPSPDDAVYEAIRQNPMVKMSVASYRVRDDILYVNYTSDADDMRSQVTALADEAVAAAVDDGMSDAEKVTALNRWIVDNMEYDYQALADIESTLGRLLLDDTGRYSDARGGLIDKLVICGGYADTFNLLARKAGLESVYVSGIVAESGSGHAWNHVKVDGVWKAIDTTWNDGGDETAYLLINESDFTGVAERSTRDSGWIVPQYQHLYATP